MVRALERAQTVEQAAVTAPARLCRKSSRCQTWQLAFRARFSVGWLATGQSFFNDGDRAHQWLLYH